MSWIADIVARGVTPRQHHDPSYNENLRIVSYSCRVAPSAEIAEDWDHEPGTVGDDLGHALWRERKGQRKMPGWSSAWPVVVSGATGPSGGGTGVPARWFVYPDRGNSVPDTRFVAKEPASFSGGYPAWATRFPSGWTAILNAGTAEQDQRDVFHPDFLGLVAGNRGSAGYSTRVLDMQAGQIDATMAADLSTVFSVEDIIATTTPFLQTGKVVATQLGQTGQGDGNSAGMMNLGWNNGSGKNLLCLNGTVGGPFITPASAAVQIGAARGNVPIYPACMSTDMLHRVPGTGMLGPMEHHGFDPKPLQPDLPWGLVQSRILWKPRPISPAAFLGTNLNTPGSFQIWTAVPYIDRPRPTTGTAPRPGFGNVPLIGSGPTGSGPRQSGGGIAGGGPGGRPGGPPGQPLPPFRFGGGLQGGLGGGPRRNPLGGFGIPNAGGGGNGPLPQTQHGRDKRDNSASAKRARLRKKLKEGRERRAEKRADREAAAADRRARNPRGRKAREAREARRDAKAARKQARKDRKDARDKARKDKRQERKDKRQRRKDRRKEKEKRRKKKALERDKTRRKSVKRSGGSEGIPLFPRVGGGGYDPPPSQVYPATVGSLGGFEFIAGAYARGADDLAGTAAGDMDQNLIGLLMGAPCVGRLKGYAKNPTGGWGSFDYADRERAIAAGGSIALLPAGYDLEAELRGEEQPLAGAIGTASLMMPSDIAQMSFGAIDSGSGGFRSGVSMGTTSLLDQFAIRSFDGNAAFTGNEYLLGETGHVFNGKTTMNGRLDPWTCEFTDRVGINDIPSGNQGFRFDSTVNATHPLFSHSSGPQVTDVVAFLSDITAGGGSGGGIFQLLSKTVGVDLLTAANTALYVVPAGEEAIATRMVIVPTTITGAITSAPRVGAGTNGGADDIIAGSTRVPNLTVGKAYSFNVLGESEIAQAAETISFGVDAAGGGATTLEVTVYLFGYFATAVPGGGSGSSGSTRFIEGLVVERASNTTMTVRPGSCRNSIDTGLITLAAKTTADVTIKHLGGTGLAQINGIDEKGLDNLTVGAITCTQVLTTITATADITPHLGTRAITGTITTVGTALTGVGTLFTEELSVGDLVGNSTNGWSQVIGVASDTAATLTLALPGGNVAGVAAVVIHNPTIQPAAGVTERPRTINAAGTAIVVLLSTAHPALSALTIGGSITRGSGLGSPEAHWLAVWVIDDGVTPATLISTQHVDLLSLPAGYTTARRVGWALYGDFEGSPERFSPVYYEDGGTHRYVRHGRDPAEFIKSDIQAVVNTWTEFEQGINLPTQPSSANMPRTSTRARYGCQLVSSNATAGNFRAQFRVRGELGIYIGARKNDAAITVETTVIDLHTDRNQVFEIFFQTPVGGTGSVFLEPWGFYDDL